MCKVMYMKTYGMGRYLSASWEQYIVTSKNRESRENKPFVYYVTRHSDSTPTVPVSSTMPPSPSMYYATDNSSTNPNYRN